MKKAFQMCMSVRYLNIKQRRRNEHVLIINDK